MRWPPNKAWTSSEPREGFRHFEVDSYGGKGDERWVELIAILDESIRFKVSWTELKTFAKWTSGWLQLPKQDENT
ncbi:TIGR02450 family Trp-rich protein [Prochlorococcus sp. MIT 1223]|uniref:TIGR02450 family Trp-rich protein n=1 Tax=Prochlorococcus sp. MIT 1223 TaxID=3096217 RepID=UPI002A755240|nr:TIGR02450 family Trp-rich protein [Prochlorococcus sp. MIT 1223]